MHVSAKNAHTLTDFAGALGNCPFSAFKVKQFDLMPADHTSDNDQLRLGDFVWSDDSSGKFLQSVRVKV